MNIRYVLNSPVLTDYGDYSFTGPLELEAARNFLARGEFVSAIGHDGAAEFLTTLLGVAIPMQRITIRMQPGDEALVLRLGERLPVGGSLTAEETRAFPCELGLLVRNL